MVEEMAGVGEREAMDLLQVHPEPALAALVALGLSPERAEALLEERGVREALKEVGR